MSDEQDRIKSMQEELRWISISEKTSYKDKLMAKGLYGILVPLGCIATTGILVTGIFNMLKRDSAKQQRLMRYRVLAQGVTLALATLGMSNLKFSS